LVGKKGRSGHGPWGGKKGREKKRVREKTAPHQKKGSGREEKRKARIKKKRRAGSSPSENRGKPVNFKKVARRKEIFCEKRRDKGIWGGGIIPLRETREKGPALLAGGKEREGKKAARDPAIPEDAIRRANKESRKKKRCCSKGKVDSI